MTEIYDIDWAQQFKMYYVQHLRKSTIKAKNDF